MKKTLLGVLALGAIVATSVMPAQAAPTDFPIGRKCGFSSQTDFTAESQTQFGVAYAGPLASQTPGTFECQIYVNGVAAPEGSAAAHTTAAGAVHVAVVAGPITYHSFVTDVVEECTFFHGDDGTELWWHVAQDTTDVTGSKWEDASVTPVNTGLCGAATTIDPNPEACPPLLTIDKATGNAAHLAETWQDCEPYSPII